MRELSGADALLAQLLANGVDTIFGLPGSQLCHFFDAMHSAHCCRASTLLLRHRALQQRYYIS